MLCGISRNQGVTLLLCFFVFFLFWGAGAYVCTTWKFLGWGSNPRHSSDPSCCSDTRSLTCCTARELCVFRFYREAELTFCHSGLSIRGHTQVGRMMHQGQEERSRTSLPSHFSPHPFGSFIFCVYFVMHCIIEWYSSA